MEVRILGPLEVHAGDGAMALGGAKARALLAVLALHANRPVSAERLTVAVWGDEAPPGAVKALQVHVSRLRKALGDNGVLETTPAGYRLVVGPGELDAERFERELAAGREALATGDAERAADVLRDALGMWRGPPLAGLEFAPFAQAEIRRLEDQRLAALEARVEADLRAGRHATLVSELRGLLAGDPTREGFASQLMLALYRSGRQAEALDVYGQTRAALVDRFGIEPGPELRRLQAAVLGQDASLELPAPVRELPAALDAQRAPRLVGRDAALARLREHWRAARTGSGRVVTLYGAEGIGKTRLAAELAGEAHRAGGAVVYLAAADPGAAGTLRRLRDALRPTLAVLDDADRAPEEVRAALAELPGGTVLVLACAREPDGLACDDALVLAPLDPQAVRTLAADRHVPAEPLLADGDGVPRRLHRLASRWAEREAARRVDTAAERAADRRAALRSVEDDLAGRVVELQAAREDAALAEDDEALVGCPFKGLAAFDVADAPYFFGRERLVAELVARLVGAPLLGVVGPSGSGKSSVVRAGLLPALAHGVLPGSVDWEQVVMRPGEHPLRELTGATAQVRGGRRLVLLVDQFEETFTVCRDERERSAFVARLTAAGSTVVVLAIRADHYGRCGAYPELSRRLAAHHVLVSAMRRDELRRAVERPAQRAGLRVEPELTDVLVDDVEHEPGALPMLSAALLELWQRRDGRRLRLSTYEATGGVRGAVARHAEDAFDRLDRHQQALARGVLLRLATEDAGGTIERRRIPLTELDGDVAGVVAVLTDQRLLTVSAGAVELAHEALLREWPRLRGWLEEDADGRRVHRRLAEAAREWDEAGRDPGDLYRGARLAGVLEWRARHEGDLNRTERAFIEASRGTEERERHAARARHRRAVALGIAALVAITGISLVLGLRGIERTHAAQRAAASRTLATQAEARLPDNIALAGLLALEADRREPTPEAQSAVLGVLQSLAGDRRVGAPLQNGTTLRSVAFSPDGRTLAAAGDDGTISWWDASARRRLREPVAAHAGAVQAVVFSPDGRRLASGGDDGTVRLWDVATGRPIGHVLRFESRFVVDDVAFSPDGEILAASGNPGPSFFAGSGRPGRVRLWDARTGRSLGGPLRAASAGLRAPGAEAAAHLNPIAFSPDGRHLAASLVDTTVRIWDLPSRRVAELIHLPSSEEVETLAFSPDGSLLATGGTDTVVRMWDVRAGQPQGGPLGGPQGDVNSVAFSPDGRMLAAGGSDGSVWLGTVADHRLLAVLSRASDRPRRQTFTSSGSVSAVAFNPRGATLASADDGGAVQLWAVEAGHALNRAIGGHGSPVHGVAYLAGDTVAAAGSDGTTRLWDVRTRRALGGPVRVAGPVLAIAANPDRRTLAVAGAHGMLQVWDARARRPIGPPLRGFSDDVKAVAFSPDGDTLAAGGADGTVRLWSARTWDPAGPPLDAHTVVNGLAFGRDGKVLAAAGQDWTVRLWDVGRHRPLGEPLRGPAGFLAAVAFSPDGKTLAAAGADKSVWLWDAGTRRSLGPPLTGHTDVLHALAFSPDGRTLASAGADHTVRLWDVAARRPLGRPLDHGSWVTALAFDSRGTSLASAGSDGTIRLWDPILWSHDRDALRQRVCSAIQRNLTRAEWAQYLPDQPYDRTCR